MKKFKKFLAMVLCCLIISFDAGSNYCYASALIPPYTIGSVAWDVVGWALLSALGIAVGESTGAVDYLTDNVWSPLVAHLKEKWGKMCDVFIDKTNKKSYVSKDIMQDSLDWGIENKLWNIHDEPDLQPSLETQMHHFYDTDKFIDYLDGKFNFTANGKTYSFNSKEFLNEVDKTSVPVLEGNLTIARFTGTNVVDFYNIEVPVDGYVTFYRGDYDQIYVRVYDGNIDVVVPAPGSEFSYNLVNKQVFVRQHGDHITNDLYGMSLGVKDIKYIYANMGTGQAVQAPSLQPSLEAQMHHFYDTKKFINYLDGKYTYTHDGKTYSFDSKDFLQKLGNYPLDYNFTIANFNNSWEPYLDIYNIPVPEGGYAILKHTDGIRVFVYDKNNNAIDAHAHAYSYNFVTKTAGYVVGGVYSNDILLNNIANISANMGTGEASKDYAIDAGLTVPKAGDKIDDWLAAQDKVNGGSVGLLGNDVSIPSDVTGTDTAIDALPLTIPSFADLVINGQPAIDDILSQGLVKANTGAIADSQTAAGAVVGAEDEAATGENAEANAISVDQAQAALKNLMQQGIDYITLQIPNNFWNKIPFSIPYDIYLLIHGIFVGSPGGSKKAPRRESSSGSNMPVGDPSNVGIEIDIPTVPLKYTEEKTEDTPPNFTFTLNIPYTTPEGQTANFNKEFTIETAKYNYFAKLIKFSIGLLWLSSVFQWLLAIFSKG